MTLGREVGQPAWLLDEIASIGRENLDASHVARYDDKEDADAAAEVRLLQAAGFGPDTSVVDLGAGTGQFSLAASQVWRRVVAVDPSPVMVARLADNARRIDAALEIVTAGFLSYEHSGEPPDLVYSRYALHHIPDFWKAVALRRMKLMLRPGGTLRLWDIVYSFPVDEVDERIEGWCSTLPDEAPEGEWRRSDIEEHVRDENSTFSWLLEPMIEAAGFTIESADHSDDRFFVRYMLTA